MIAASSILLILIGIPIQFRDHDLESWGRI